MSENTTNVYVIAAGRSLVKIGLARDTKRRMCSLQTAHAKPLSLLYSQEVPADIASDVERRAHWLLRDRHRSGEWFTTGKSEAIEAVASAVESRGAGEKARFTVGRPPLSKKSATTTVLIRLPADTVARIDAVAGPNRRGQFIREAAIKEVERQEKAVKASPPTPRAPAKLKDAE
jgi:hypothetical protein